MKTKAYFILFTLTMLSQVMITNINVTTQQTPGLVTDMTIIMQNTGFHPNSSTVQVNEVVNFTIINKDAFSHTFTITNISSWRVPPQYTVKNGTTVDYTVNGSSSVNFLYKFPSVPQTIKFYCRFHSIMYGYFYVEAATTKSTSTPFSESSFLIAIFSFSLMVVFERKSHKKQ